jgi:hypothetical protein
MIDFVVTAATCKKCSLHLVRVKQARTDHVVCPGCWAAGEYASVIGQSAGLRRGWEIPDDLKGHVSIASALGIARSVLGIRAA